MGDTMLRIHFTNDDLARITVAAEPDPLWEVLLSLHLLQVPLGPLHYGRWRQHARSRLRGHAIQDLLELTPAHGYSPDFLTPTMTQPGQGLRTAIESLLTTPRHRVRHDLAILAARTAGSRWTRQLADGGADSMRRLGRSVHSYHRAAIAPYWSSIRSQVRVDHERRVGQLLAGGTDRLLTGLNPRVRWRSPVLEILDFADTDLHLNGRGLRLQPSLFCWQTPTKLRDDQLAPVLVYPIELAPGMLQAADATVGPGDSSAAVAALMGRTRGAMLEATAVGCTTTDLARRFGVSPAAASQHATVLRDAGLISTRRDGRCVIHEISPVGIALLDAPRTRR